MVSSNVVNLLMMQISSLKQQLTAAAEHETAAVAKLKHDHERELCELRADLAKAADEYSNKVHSLESSNRNEISAINERHQRQLKVADVTCCTVITYMQVLYTNVCLIILDEMLLRLEEVIVSKTAQRFVTVTMTVSTVVYISQF